MSTRWPATPRCSTPARRFPACATLEKYATRMGGAPNYRMGLWDAAMIKDNHVAVAGGVGAAVARAKAAGIARIICEVDRLDQIEPALAAGATHLLLDNMAPDDAARGRGAGRRPRADRGQRRRAARHHRRDRGERRGLRLGRPADAKRAGGGYRAGFRGGVMSIAVSRDVSGYRSAVRVHLIGCRSSL